MERQIVDRLIGNAPMKLRWPLRRRTQGSYVRSSDVSVARHGDRVVLMDLAGEQFYSLDQVAGRIWDLLAEPATPAALAERIAEEFDAPVETIRGDVAECLAGLERDGLVRTR